MSERDPDQKYFAFHKSLLHQTEVRNKLDADVNFKNAKDAQHVCENTVSAYYDTMVHDIWADNNDFLDDLKISRGELVAKLTKNKCIGTLKYLAHEHRRTVAEMIENHHFKEER